VTIGFYLIDRRTLDSMCGYKCAEALVESARKVMPDVPVVHFTDNASPEVRGTDTMRLASEPMARLRMRHHSHVSGEWLFVDTDVLFQQDVQHVFDKDFDLAVPSRGWGHLKKARGFTKRMPANMGVVFSRSAAFWTECLARVRELSKIKQHWMGDQEVFCGILAEDRYRVRELKGSVYNFPPSLDDNETSQALEAQAAIVHFKGEARKPMMLRRIGAVIP
jgi:hypothetical protein